MMTNQEIATDVFGRFDQSEIAALARVKQEDLIEFHHSLGAHIRNHYGLWSTPHVPVIVDHCDVSPNNPDNKSFEIIKLIHEMCLQTVKS